MCFPASCRGPFLTHLSLFAVGYSTCHWCHVMEEESFKSKEIGEIMNEHFVCIKVDREERPDVDKVYMTFVQVREAQAGPRRLCLAPSGCCLCSGKQKQCMGWYGWVTGVDISTHLSLRESLGCAGGAQSRCLLCDLGAHVFCLSGHQWWRWLAHECLADPRPQALCWGHVFPS